MTQIIIPGCVLMRLWKPFAQRGRNWSSVQPVSCQSKAVYLEHYFDFFFFSLRMLGLEKLSHKSYSYAFYSLCGYRARIKPPANSPGHLYSLRRFLACDSLLWDVLFVTVLALEWDSTQILSVDLLSCMCSLHVLLPETLPHLSSPWWPGRGCTSMAKDWH